MYVFLFVMLKQFMVVFIQFTVRAVHMHISEITVVLTSMGCGLFDIDYISQNARHH